MRLNADGRLGFRTLTPGGGPNNTAVIDIWDEDGLHSDVQQRVAGNGNNSAFYTFAKSRGSLLAPLTAVSGDRMGHIEGQFYNGTAWNMASSIDVAIDSIPSGDAPGNISFNTTAVGATTVTQRMIIKSNGSVGIGVSTPNSPLTVRTSHAWANARMTSLANAISDQNFELVTQRGATTNGVGNIMTSIGQAYGGGSISEGIHFIRGIAASDGAIAFSTSSATERMRILSNGTVGIGTSTPSGFVHLSTSQAVTQVNQSSSTIGTWLSINNSSTGGQWFQFISTGSGNGEGAGKLILTKGGSVGSTAGNFATWDWATLRTGMGGVTTPTAIVDIAGNAGGTNSLQLRSGNVSNGTTSNQILLGYNGTDTYRHAIKSRHNGSSAVGNSIDFYLWKQGTDLTTDIGTDAAVTIDGNYRGMIGVGTTAPKSEVHISDGSSSLKAVTDAGGYGASLLITDNSIPRIYFENASQGTDLKMMGITALGSTLSIGALNDAASAWTNQFILTADRGGNVGIGTGSPSVKLDVEGGTTSPAFKLVDGTQGANKVLVSDAAGNASWASSSILPASNIYTADGTLAGARTVTMGGNSLTFNGSANYSITGTGSVGIHTTSPVSLLANTSTNIIGSDFQGINPNSLTWVHNANGYAMAVYNSYASAAGNGLAVKIAGTASNTRILDLSTGATQNVAGTTVMEVQGDGKVGIGTGSPAYRMHVYTPTNGDGIMLDGSSSVGFALGTSGTVKAQIGIAAGAGAWSTDAAVGDLVIRSQSTAQKILFNTNGGTGGASVAINGSTMGIGTLAPAASLDVVPSGGRNVLLGGGANTGSEIKFTYSGVVHHSIYSNGNGNLTFANTSGGFGVNVAGSPLMSLSAAGYLGIGTTSPAVPLDVQSSIAYNAGNYGYLNSIGSGTSSCTNCQTSIRASGRIVSPEFNATSDRRIKDIQDISNGAADLATLNQLEVTDFYYKDKVASGGELKKGFIAQQVETNYPEAVHRMTNYVPDVYALASHVNYDGELHTLTITVDKAHSLVVGNKVRLVTEKTDKLEAVVSEVRSDNTFTVKDISESAKSVFVYGKEVEDFRVVDYDRIYTLNVSATQELCRRIAALQNENETLKNNDSKQNETIKTMKAQIDAINERLNMTSGK